MENHDSIGINMYFELYSSVKKISLLILIIFLSGCASLHFTPARQKTSTGNTYAAERIPALLNEADDFYRADNLSLAEDKYLSVIELDAKQPRALYRLGNITFKLAQYEKARDYFSRTVDADPGNSKAHYNLAVTHITLAQENFKAYIAGEPNNAHRPQIETLMRHIDEFAQEKPSDATLPVSVEQSSNYLRAEKPSAIVAQPAAHKPSIVRRPVKKPKKHMIKKPASTMKMMPTLQKKPQPAAALEVDPLDALANQLKNP